jgi:SAM-dependent methyltransferase
MHPDIADLRAFYGSPLGTAARRSIAAVIGRIWPSSTDLEIAGLGYCPPFFDSFASDAKRCLALMPAAQGAVAWPARTGNRATLVVDEQLPLSDSCLDRLLVIHALEQAESPSEVLREAWRVLVPGGRLLLVIPNRRGVWARSERTPFGTGQPFSRSQVAHLLREALLSPVQWRHALAFPPVRRRSWVRVISRIDRLIQRFAPGLGGVIVVEAEKRLYQGLPAAARQQRRIFVPVFVPASTPRSTRGRASQ